MISKQKAADILGLKPRTIEYFMYEKWQKGVHWYSEGRIVFIDMHEVRKWQREKQTAGIMQLCYSNGKWHQEVAGHYTFLYLMRCGEFAKIGISDNPTKRLASIQSGNPHLVELEALYLPCWMSAKELEKILHKKYKPKKVRGEWFSDDVIPALMDSHFVAQ